MKTLLSESSTIATRIALLLTVIVAALTAAGSTARAFDSVDDERTWAVTGLEIIDVVTGEILHNRTIVVRAGTIEAVQPTTATELPDDTIVVDEHGRFAIPGLWDMHVHMRGGPALETANERWLARYLGFGVTSVRDAGGDLPGAVLRWREAVRRGELAGPRIFTSLRKIDGVRGARAGSLAVGAPDEVGATLVTLADRGADFVKIYDGSITPGVYLAALEAAEQRGMPTAAHVPLSVAFDAAVNAGLDSVEHAFHLVKAAHPRDAAVSREFARDGIPAAFEPFFVTIAELGAAAEDASARRSFRNMLKHGVALTPTLYIREVWNDVTSESSHAQDARLAEVPMRIRHSYAAGIATFARRTEAELASDRALERISGRLTRLAAEIGVTILAGSDTGATNPYVYPGDSLHGELASLVAAGLTSLAALRAATIEPARWFDRAETLGSIAPGKAADFVILERNPLADISNTRSLVAVAQQGVFFDAAELETLRTLADD